MVIGDGILSPSSKGKIVVSGEAAGLQIQLGPPAVPGRFDSCDLPPKRFMCLRKTAYLYPAAARQNPPGAGGDRAPSDAAGKSDRAVYRQCQHPAPESEALPVPRVSVVYGVKGAPAPHEPDGVRAGYPADAEGVRDRVAEAQDEERYPDQPGAE